VGNAGENTAVTVQVVRADGKAEPRAIRIGIKSELLAEVKDGLAEKERVVIGSVAAKGAATKSALSSRKGP
jgi:macrolide-specific efflux system membrane fusion protein